MPEAKPATTPSPGDLSSGKTAIALSATIDQIKKIAAESGDHLFLSDRAPHPDFKLLDLCGDLLYGMKRIAEKRDLQRKATIGTPRYSELESEIKAIKNHIAPMFGYAKRTSATTGAGIFAKALVCRNSETGSTKLAMSLAEDLVASPQLRATLWQDAEARS